MTPRHAIVCLMVLTGLAAHSVRADLTAFWRNNPITTQAIFNDPTLAGMQSWSVMITNTSGFWVSAGLRAALPTGNNFYRNPLGGDFRPSASLINANPALAFHTYVTEPRTFNSGLAVLGGFPEGQQVSFGGPLDAIPGTFSVAWGDVFGKPHPAGTFEIARLTFPTGMLPIVHPQSQTRTAVPDQMAFIPSIPEPAYTAMAYLVLAALNTRHRRTARRVGHPRPVTKSDSMPTRRAV